MPYDINSIDNDCYPNTTTLINKFDIRDGSELEEIEVVVVSARAAEWEISPKDGNFDFNHYRAIHNHLFLELYDWAGHIRKINISKKGTLFCPAEDITELSSRIFHRLQSCNFYRGYNYIKFVDSIIDFYCSTNFLHPFREGNGRTQRIFITQLIKSAGYKFEFSNIDIDLLMIATIQSTNGIIDLLRQIFNENIRK